MNLADLPAPRVVGRVPFKAISHAHFDVSPDGRYVAMLSGRNVELFDAHGELLARLSRDDVHDCGCFLDDERLLVGRVDGSLLLLSVEALSRAGVLEGAAALALGTVLPCCAALVGQVVLSPDGARVAVAGGQPLSRGVKADKVIRVLDAATLKEQLALKGMRRRATDLAFSPDNQGLAVAGDVAVRVYELAKGRAIAAIGFDDDAGVAWSLDGALFTLGRTHGLRRWNLADGSVTAQTPYPQQSLRGPRAAADGAVVVVSGGAYRPMVVDRLDGATLAPLATRAFDHMPLWPGQPRVAPDGAVWIAHGLAFRPLDGPDLAARPRPDGHVDMVVDFVVHPDGRYAASADFTANVLVWDLDAGRVVHAFAVETQLIADVLLSTCKVLALAFAPRAPRVFVAVEPGALRSYDCATGAPGWSLSAEAFGPCLRLFPAPDGEAVLVVDGDAKGRCALRFVDARGRTRWSTTTDLFPLQVHWEDDALVLFDEGGSARLRLTSGALTDRWRLPDTVGSRGPSVAVSDDGELAAATTAGRIMVWRSEEARVLATAHGARALTGLAWTRDRALLTVDELRRVEARDPATLAVTATLATPTNVRWTVHPARDGRRLVVPAMEGYWLVYEIG